MMQYTYMTKGTCCKEMRVTLDDNKKMINIEFLGGCPGNLNALKTLMMNKPYTEFMGMFSQNTCGNKQTSCMREFDTFLSMIDADIKDICSYPFKTEI